MLSKMFQRGGSSVSRPEVRRAASSFLEEYLVNSSGLLSSIRRMMFSQNRKDNDRRDFQAEFEKLKQFSKEEEEKQKRMQEEQPQEPKQDETYEEQVKRKQQQRADASEEAFKEQQEKLKDKFEKTKNKDQISFFDVFSDVREELGNRLKASGEFMSRTSTKISQRATQAKESWKKKETNQQGVKEGQQTQEKEEVVKKEEKMEGEAQEEIKQEPQVTKKSEEVQYNIDRRSYAERIGDRFAEKKGNFAKKVEEKSPGLYKVSYSISSNFSRYWDMTFPNYQKKAINKINKLKQEGEQLLTEEEQEQIQSQIPEWKRTALQVSEEKNPQKKRSLLRQMRDKMSEKVKQTHQYKQLRETDSYKKYSEFKEDYKEFKDNLREQVEASPNKFVSVSRQLYDRAKADSPFAKALLKMRQRDPEFEIESLKAQIPYIVHPLYAEFLEDNIEYLEKCCEDHALGYLKSRIKARHNRKVVPKYKVPIFVDEAYFLGGKLGEKGEPQFIYSIRIEEINCLLNKDKPEEIKEGDDDSILGSHFRLVIEPHHSPDLQLMGHYWKFVEFEKIQETEMLV